MTPEMIELLRSVDEDTVAAALDGSLVSLPLTDHAMVVEVFQSIVDLLMGERALSEED